MQLTCFQILGETLVTGDPQDCLGHAGEVFNRNGNCGIMLEGDVCDDVD